MLQPNDLTIDILKQCKNKKNLDEFIESFVHHALNPPASIDENEGKDALLKYDWTLGISGLNFNSRLAECSCTTAAHYRYLPGNSRSILENHIIDFADKKDERNAITLLSVGSGGCLQDLLIVCRLYQLGYKKIYISLVDPNYQFTLKMLFSSREKRNAYLEDCEKHIFMEKNFISICNAMSRFKVKIIPSVYSSVEEIPRTEKYDIAYAIDFQDFSPFKNASVSRLLPQGDLNYQVGDQSYKSNIDLIKALQKVEINGLFVFSHNFYTNVIKKSNLSIIKQGIMKQFERGMKPSNLGIELPTERATEEFENIRKIRSDTFQKQAEEMGDDKETYPEYLQTVYALNTAQYCYQNLTTLVGKDNFLKIGAFYINACISQLLIHFNEINFYYCKYSIPLYINSEILAKDDIPMIEALLFDYSGKIPDTKKNLFIETPSEIQQKLVSLNKVVLVLDGSLWYSQLENAPKANGIGPTLPNAAVLRIKNKDKSQNTWPLEKENNRILLITPSVTAVDKKLTNDHTLLEKRLFQEQCDISRKYSFFSQKMSFKEYIDDLRKNGGEKGIIKADKILKHLKNGERQELKYELAQHRFSLFGGGTRGSQFYKQLFEENFSLEFSGHFKKC